MTPIYCWFFRHFKEQAHHFNHADLFHSPEQLDPHALLTAIEAVIKHHDMLRLGCCSVTSSPVAGCSETSSPVAGCSETSSPVAGCSETSSLDFNNPPHHHQGLL
ncbi:MAG: hypothetical protein HQK66_15645 [Desulfamplus sp.]|nr:hypothetical protein [Desulfamplus sp.]